MTSYILLAAGAVFLTVIVSFIVPKGRLGKSINFVLRLACILIIISPVTAIFDLTFSEEDGELIDYEYISQVYSENQSRTLERMIEEEFGVECVCEVEILYSDGSFRENGVSVTGDFVEKDIMSKIQSYLRELGYININVNEKTA